MSLPFCASLNPAYNFSIKSPIPTQRHQNISDFSSSPPLPHSKIDFKPRCNIRLSTDGGWIKLLFRKCRLELLHLSSPFYISLSVAFLWLYPNDWDHLKSHIFYSSPISNLEVSHTKSLSNLSTLPFIRLCFSLASDLGCWKAGPHCERRWLQTKRCVLKLEWGQTEGWNRAFCCSWD